MIVVDHEKNYLRLLGDSNEISADLELAVRGMLSKTYEHYGKEATDYIAVLLVHLQDQWIFTFYCNELCDKILLYRREAHVTFEE